IKVLALPEVRKQFADLGIDVIGGTPAEFAAVIATETVQWAKLIKAMGIGVIEESGHRPPGVRAPRRRATRIPPAGPGANLWPFDRRATTKRRRIAAPERHAMNAESHQLVESVVAAFKRGEIVVVTDDDDRENEGDLFVAASMCTPEKMAFII